jgi:chromosome segregation ATPase
MDFAKFELLEQKVSVLMEKKAAAEAQSRDLSRELDALRNQLADALKRNEVLTEERLRVAERLDALLARLE